MGGGLNKRRATALLEQARARLTKKPDEAESLARQVVEGLPTPEAFAVLAEARERQGEFEAAVEAADAGLKRFPKSAAIEAWKGGALVRAGRAAEGRKLLERARPQLAKDAGFFVFYAWALSQTGEPEKAETAARKAVELGGGPAAKLELAKLLGRHGHYAEAEGVLAPLEKAKLPAEQLAEVKAVRGDAQLFQGDAEGAVTSWKALLDAGRLPDAYLGHFAYAAQLAGDAALADRLIAKRKSGASPEDLLLFGLIALNRGEAQQALERLALARGAPGPRPDDFDYELLAAEGRALRILGKPKQSREKLQLAAARPEYASRRLGPRVRVDLAHLAAEEGDFETSAQLLGEALALDPGDPEAARAMELTQRRVAWKTELAKDATAKVEAAQLEAEAMRRRFVSRESQLEAEVAQARAAREEAERKAREAIAQAREAEERARSLQREHVGQALAARETEADERAKENVERALDGLDGVCPAELRKGVEVAEATFQRALYIDLPASPVALLYSGALERALFFAYVRRFEEWLKAGGRLKSFLEGAVKSIGSGKRVEYFDRFAEAFDPALKAKAPALGEVGRVIERRHESHLKPFRAFLDETYQAPDAFYAELAEFVRWAKETLRDPSAHGRIANLGYHELRRFRDQLLFDFGGRKRGALAQMLEPKRP